MNAPKLFTFLSFCFISVNLFAQTPKAIEADLLKAFKKIDYRKDDNADANDLFAKKLLLYAEKYPFTISQKFESLKKEHLNISNSSDGLFRVYSWDTWTGGTTHYFESVFQYKSGIKTSAVLDAPKGEGYNRPNYQKVYTFNDRGKAYYLCVYLEIFSTKDVGDGIHIFTIENGKLIDAKLIKTHSGLHSELSYGYDFGSVVNIDYDKRPRIRFDDNDNIIYLPMVNSNNQMTNKVIRYKFTGKYFELVKN